MKLRLLKKWSKHLPDGVEFVLSGRLDELTITGKTKRKEVVTQDKI